MSGFEPLLSLAAPRRSVPPRPPARPERKVPGFAPSLDIRPAPAPLDAELVALLHAEAAETEAAAAAADRAIAFAEGHAAGLREAAEGHQATVTAALVRMPPALDALALVARDAVQHQAEHLATALFAALDAALPDAALRHAPDAAAALVRQLAPLLDQEIGVTLRAAPELVEDIAARIADPRLAVAADPTIPPGDLHATWQGGAARFDLSARRAAIRTALAEAGLALED